MVRRLGCITFDIRDCKWLVQGLEPNYGLVVAATDEGLWDGGAFYTTEATADNAA